MWAPSKLFKAVCPERAGFFLGAPIFEKECMQEQGQEKEWPPPISVANKVFFGTSKTGFTVGKLGDCGPDLATMPSPELPQLLFQTCCPQICFA